MRFVRKDRRIYDFSHCNLCGCAWGAYPSGKCPKTICRACGSTQCLVNGLGNGCCSICYFGYLDGWNVTGRKCGYKDCNEEAVSRAPRIKRCCRKHLNTAKVKHNQTLLQYIEECLKEREKAWELVNDE